MRLANINRVYEVRMPEADLLALCIVPEFRQLCAAHQWLVRVQSEQKPWQLFLSAKVVPALHAIRSSSPVMARLQRSLGRHPRRP